MFDAIVNGLSGLGAGVLNLHWSNPIMIAVGCGLLYLGIKKDVEPLLLVPIGFGAILINIPLFRRYHYSFFQVMDGAVIGLAFGIAFGRIGDLIIGDHLGKPTSWLLAFQYEGGNLSGFACAEGSCRATLEGGQVLTITHQVARLTAPTGRLLAEGVGVHQTALYDMFFATCLFLVLYALSRAPRRLGVLTLVFGAWILQHEGPKRGVSVEHINTMVFWALIGTIIGARLFFVIGTFYKFTGVAHMLEH